SGTRRALATREKARHKRAMSGHGHDDGNEAHEAHDDHHHHETTSDDFPDDEPRSPGWLPLLGGLLFLAGILAFFVFTGSDAAADGSAPAAIQSAAAVPAPTAPPARAQAAGRPAMRLPAGLQFPPARAPGAAPQ
ncbi:MAG: hypothetical protein ABJB12_22610, partial [Pseudomonadota bacterium]